MIGDVVLGVIAIGFGVYLIVWRHREAARVIRARNRSFERMRLKRRYGEREAGHNVRANVIVGVFGILLGIALITDLF